MKAGGPVGCLRILAVMRRGRMIPFQCVTPPVGTIWKSFPTDEKSGIRRGSRQREPAVPTGSHRGHRQRGVTKEWAENRPPTQANQRAERECSMHQKRDGPHRRTPTPQAMQQTPPQRFLTMNRVSPRGAAELRVYPETQAAFCRGLRMYRNSAWCLFGFGDRRLSIR